MCPDEVAVQMTVAAFKTLLQVQNPWLTDIQKQKLKKRKFKQKFLKLLNS